jgi:hypothetical protein
MDPAVSVFTPGHLQKPVLVQRIDDSLSPVSAARWKMSREPGLFDVEARLREMC